MLTYVVKASDDNYVKPITINNLGDIQKLIAKEGTIIIEPNIFWQKTPIEIIKKCFNLEDNQYNNVLAKRISKSNYFIKIYDDYIE